MPSIVTHHLFAKDILSTLDKKINQKYFYIFAQSFDNLFYYKFFMPIFGKEIRKLGNKAQETNINDYFQNILKFIKESHLETNEDLLGYLYGSICHYALDTIAHPYIIYETGLVKINPKYRGGHEKMEVMIDAILYEEKTKIPLRKAKLANDLLPKTNYSKPLKNCLDYTMKKTFNINNGAKIYEQGVKNGHTIIKYFVTDHTGIKKKMYQIIDLFSKKRMYQYLNFHITKLNKTVLNNDHHIWHYPSHYERTKNSSFAELYNEAQEQAKKLIQITNQYFKNQVSLETVLQTFGNKSYVTGIDYQDKNPIQYFKF